MIQEDEFILFINQAKTAVLMKEDESLKTGLQEKKIVVTTKRCLFFQSLSNVVSEIQYEIIQKKKNLGKPKEIVPQDKKKISVNQFPEHSFPVSDRQSKIIINEEPSCHKYLQKSGLKNIVKSTTGIVILKNMTKYKFQLLSFPALKDAFRFAKALQCAKIWILYEKFCRENKVDINHLWVSIVQDIINNQKSVVPIDPDLFLSGSKGEIKSFQVLFGQIFFVHSFQHRYIISTNEICQYANQFLKTFEKQTHSLIFCATTMTDSFFNHIISGNIKLSNLMHLDVSKNKLTDVSFIYLQKLSRQAKKLSYFNLSHNEITFKDPNGFINFLKGTQIALTINLSNNLLEDDCIQTIEKFVIFPHNPPLQQINFSYNKFTKKGAWLLFVGNRKLQKYHPQMNFVIYPIPFKPQTFPQSPISYPISHHLINYNMHSALVEQFEEESFMKHTLHQVLNPESTTIRFIRKLSNKICLPGNKQEVQQTLALANEIQNFINAPQSVQRIYELAQKIEQFPFNLPPMSRKRFIAYLSDKLNQALFIRDHYAVRYILLSFQKLDINYQGYLPRLKKVASRDQIVCASIQAILNFQVDQIDINNQLDEMVREGLRLYLEGEGIQIIYYLKYYRDRMIEKLLYEKHNPQHLVYAKMADKNMQLDGVVSEKDLVIPYEIKVQKKINQNFYLHPWQANYAALSELPMSEYNDCLQFLEESTKRQKFALYFQRIEERIKFMTNQFKIFSYFNFKSSYHDLKINCARLLAMYYYLSEKNYYMEIPSMARKVPITTEKIISLANPKKFQEEYHIANYININKKARKAGFYNYTGRITRYESQLFYNETNKLIKLMNVVYQRIEKNALSTPQCIPQQIIGTLIEIILFIRQAVFPEQLKEQFYLRLLSFRNGRHMNNTEILKHLPFLTMYLRPPLAIEKYLISAVISNENLNLKTMPICIATDLNKKSQESVVQKQHNQYIERDWMANQNIMLEILQKNGQVELKVQFLSKQQLAINVKQSRTVLETVNILGSMCKDYIEDIQHFWLYMGYAGDNSCQLVILQENQYIGEIIIEKKNKNRFFVFKRRLYCPQFRYTFHKESGIMINQLFSEWKYQYLSGNYFVNDAMMYEFAASMLLIDITDAITEEKKINLLKKIRFQEVVNLRLKELANIYKGYIPQNAIKRSMLSQDEIVMKLKGVVSEKVLKKQNFKGLETKVKILSTFQEYPEFLCTNHIMNDRNRKQLKVCMNAFWIYIESETQCEKIGLQKIISIIPKSKYLLIYYHKHEGIIGQINIVGGENKVLSIAQQLLTYCMLRVRMQSSTLYNAYRNQVSKDKYIRNANIKDVKDKNILENIARLDKKLSMLGHTVLDYKDIIYCSPNKYIKVHSQRKNYVNASLDKLLLEPLEEDEWDNQDNQMNESSYLKNAHNIFTTLFPNLADKPKLYAENLSQEQQSQNRTNQLPSNSYYQQQYDKIGDPNIQLDQQPSNTVKKNNNSNVSNIGMHQGSDIPRNKNNNIPPIKVENSQEAINDKSQQQFQAVTNSIRKGGRLPPKRR